MKYEQKTQTTLTHESSSSRSFECFWEHSRLQDSISVEISELNVSEMVVTQCHTYETSSPTSGDSPSRAIVDLSNGRPPRNCGVPLLGR